MNAAIKVGETYDFVLGTSSMRVMVEAADEHEVVYRALNDQDAIDRGWMPTSYGTYEASTTPAEFGRDAVMTADAPTEAPQDHGPLAAPLSDRTLAKVLSRPAYDPPSPTKDAIVEAALRWHAIRNANAEDVTPLALFDADDALHTAVKVHIAAVIS